MLTQSLGGPQFGGGMQGMQGMQGGGQDQMQQVMQMVMALVGMMLSQQGGGQGQGQGMGGGGGQGMGGGGGQGGGSPLSGLGSACGGRGPLGGGASNYMGGGHGGARGLGGNSGGSSPGGSISPSGNGSDAVKLANSLVGRPSDPSLKRSLPNFQAAGGHNNNCADFVSSVLQDSGRLKGHYNSVSGLKQGLQKEGYHQVAQGKAGPGDVFISANGHHTELVASQGARSMIGSNNNGTHHQTISRAGAQRGTYYHLGN